MLVMKCDRCGAIHESYQNTELCAACQTSRIEEEGAAYQRCREEFGAVVAAQVAVFGLLSWLYTEKREQFKRSFGTDGIEHLETALAAMNATE